MEHISETISVLRNLAQEVKNSASNLSVLADKVIVRGSEPDNGTYIRNNKRSLQTGRGS